MEIDYSKFAKPALTKEDLEKALAFKTKFVDEGWYLFKTVAASGKHVTKPEIKKNDAGENVYPKGNQLIFENMRVCRPNGDFSTTIDDELLHVNTLYTRPQPELLKALGYTDEMLMAIKNNGPSAVYDMLRQRLAAFDFATYGSEKLPDGGWSKSKEEVREAVLDGQGSLWLDPTPLVGTLSIWQAKIETKGRYTNISLRFPYNVKHPPRSKDGTLTPIIDPDA